jgi:pimeloyl-ACP methyl ester carboxylesterase
MLTEHMASIVNSFSISALVCLSTLHVKAYCRATYASMQSHSTILSKAFNADVIPPTDITSWHLRQGSKIYLSQSSEASKRIPMMIIFGGAADGTISNTVKNLAISLQRKYHSSEADSREAVIIRYFTFVEEDASVNAIREHLGKYPNSPVILVGHSWGGDTAYKVADNISKDIRINLLLTLDPVGHSGINNKQDCAEEYPTGSPRISQREKQCEIQRRQRQKPANVNKWINVWAKGASAFSDLVSSAGERWNSQANADKDIPMDLAHGEARKMYLAAESTILADLNHDGLKDLSSLTNQNAHSSGAAGVILLVEMSDQQLTQTIAFKNGPKRFGDSWSYHDGVITRRIPVRSLQELPDGAYNIMVRDPEKKGDTDIFSIFKTGSSVIGSANNSTLCFRGDIIANTITNNHVHYMGFTSVDDLMRVTSAGWKNPQSNDIEYFRSIELSLPFTGKDSSWPEGAGKLFVAHKFIPLMNASRNCLAYYKWLEYNKTP